MAYHDPEFWAPYDRHLSGLVNARVAYEKAQLWGEATPEGQEELQQAGYELYGLAEAVGWGGLGHLIGAAPSALIADHPWLVADYRASLDQVLSIRDEVEEDQARWRAEQAEKEARTRVRAQLAEGAWEALDLPTPEAFLERLQAGQGVGVRWHTFFIADDMDGILVCTNDYGLDAYPGAPATVEGLTRVLRHLALGGTYGERDDWD